MTYPKHLHFALFFFFPPMTFKDDTHTFLTAACTFTWFLWINTAEVIKCIVEKLTLVRAWIYVLVKMCWQFLELNCLFSKMARLFSPGATFFFFFERVKCILYSFAVQSVNIKSVQNVSVSTICHFVLDRVFGFKSVQSFLIYICFS